MEPRKPDISQIDVRDLKNGPFPGLDTAFRISIEEAAYRSVKDHAEEDPGIEICGVLVGEVLKDEAGPFLVITAAIRGKNAAAQPGQVTFTQDAWSHILEIKDAEYPALRIVGWYHSHPSFGIFLSTQDQFVQTSLFGQPWQVAFVVDPVSGDEGFFVWHNGALSRAGRFWVGGLSRSAADQANPGPMVVKKVDEMMAAIPRPEPNKYLPVYFFSSVLLMGLLALGVYLNARSANEQMLGLLARIVRAVSQPTMLPGTLGESRLRDEALARLRQNPLLAPLDIQVFQENRHLRCSGEVYTWVQWDLVGRIITSVPGVESADLQALSVTHFYKVAEGDTLEKVALRVYGDNRKWEQIYRANQDRIKDPLKISPPLSLRIPE